MLKLQHDHKGFKIFYKNHLFITHEEAMPFLSVGRGKAKYDMKFGNFEIEESLAEKFLLNQFEILTEKDNHLQIKLWHDNSVFVVMSFVEENNRLALIFEETTETLNRCWINLSANKEEAIYGCGEQFSELNLRGKNVPLWVSEQGVGRNKKDIITFYADAGHNGGGDWYTTYFPQPTFVSDNNYFCHVEDSHYMEFDFRHETYHQLYIRAIPEKMILNKGESLIDILKDLTDYLGRQPELPQWTYDGLWLGVQGGTHTVLEKLADAEKAGVKVGALWAQDWEGRRETWFGKQLFWNWKYSQQRYPELPQLIQELEEKNIKFLGYINCFLDIEGDLYKEASEKGYMVKNSAGEDYHVVVTAFPAGIVDLTNPAAVKWIKEVIKEHMIGIGLAGWMCDFGEYLPTDAVLYSGESAESYHNKYPAMWAKANREAIEEAGKLGQVSFFTRAGYTGTSRYSTIMWAGDQLVNWSLDDGLASVIPAALSLGMSGYGIFHSDIGGYTSLFDVTRSKEVFMRWAEMGAFAPVMRTHEGNRPDESWQFNSDEETLAHFAKMSRIYTHLKPYLQQIVKENAETGIPCMRMPYLHYQNDKELANLKYQYLLGRDLMVAPVYEEGVQQQKLYLPDDNWIHLWTGDKLGKGHHQVATPLGQPAVFYRQESPFKELFAEINKL